MQISPSVRAVQVPDDEPMHPLFTSIYLVGKNGGGEALTIDSGEAVDRYKWMLRGYLAATERAEIALAGITHYHLDHSGNLKWMREALKAEVACRRRGAAVPRQGRPSARRAALADLVDGQVIDLDGGVHVQIIFTPGHCPTPSATTSRKKACCSPATPCSAAAPRPCMTSPPTAPACTAARRCPSST